MRLQHAIFCREYQRDEEGITLKGVFNELIIEGEWSGDRPPPAAFDLTLVIGLVEGKPGAHRLSLTAKALHSTGQGPLAYGPFQIDWPVGVDAFTYRVGIDFKVIPARVMFEFSILVDGNPMGRTFLPIVPNVRRAM